MTSKEEDMVLQEVTKETKEAVENESLENGDTKINEGGAKEGKEKASVRDERLKADEKEKHVDEEELKSKVQVKEKYTKEELVENENIEGQLMQRNLAEGESAREKSTDEDESNTFIEGEHLEAEHVIEEQEIKEEVNKEEEPVVEEGELKCDDLIPYDPAAPLNLTDSKELVRTPFELRPEQITEIDQLWELFQDYTPAYTDIQGYITEVELVYMLKALLLMTYTPEQMKELMEFCVRPPNIQGQITYEQFLNIATLRQRDYSIEDELKNALKVLDPNKTGKINRDFFRYVVGELGEQMLPKVLNKFIAEVDLNNDGELGLEDIYGTMCNDLGQDDIDHLKKALITPVKEEVEEEEDSI